MRLSLRFIIPLAVILSIIAFGILPIIDQFNRRWFVRDLETRVKLMADTLQDILPEMLQESKNKKITQLLNRITKEERFFALGICAHNESVLYATPLFVEEYCNSQFVRLHNDPLYRFARPLQEGQKELGSLVIIQDRGFIERRIKDAKKVGVTFMLAVGIIISGVTVMIAQWSWKSWIASIRAILRGKGQLLSESEMDSPEIRPIVRDLKTLIQDLEIERRLQEQHPSSWSPQALREILRTDLAGDEIMIVSNREPYAHTRSKNGIEVQMPVSGLVTALEPIMRACSGTWIASGGGSADRQTVDAQGRVKVPPDDPAYTLKRVWLTPEEEAGYYFGFANGGLWPLCHIVHTRPVFRSDDWKKYVAVNEKFARAVQQEVKTEDPVILVQDYHFALLPRMIKKVLPKASVVTFWHIPWPNPESFGICPWREELLDGLLGSTILGFHTRFHCNNFIDTVDRYMEANIDRSSYQISYDGKMSAVHHYPISIEWPVRWVKGQKPINQCRSSIRSSNSLSKDQLIGIGVDRLDYTKGILERFLSIERLFELYPEWVGKFTFIQIAAPTRSRINQYQIFETEVRELVKRINDRYSSPGYHPICLKIEHHDPFQVFEYYRGADLCFVNSLHDGMNLVAKEFVASREDEQGVLVLSQYTGAARELPEAIIVNPYNIDQCAKALHLALKMPQTEQRDRMRSMRGLVQEFNVYRWAGKMLMDTAKMRQRDRFREHFRHETKRSEVWSEVK